MDGHTYYNVDKLWIGNNVTSIGENAFNLSWVSDVTIPNSVTSIGKRSLRQCRIISLAIPDGVTSIGNWAFSYNRYLTSVTMGNGVSDMGDGVFEGCNSISSVYITDIAKWCGISFGSSAANPLCFGADLYLNGVKITDLVIPNTVTSIGKYVFFGCNSLTSATIPNSVTSIGDYAFYNCTNLTIVTIPDSVTSIGSYAFYGCNELTSVMIPDNVTSIGSSAFRGCSNLTSITMSNSVTSIGSSTFYDCTRLTSLYIPPSVQTINGSAFRGCSNLATFDFHNHQSVPQLGSVHAFLETPETREIVVPDALYDVWIAATNWSSTTNNIVSSIVKYSQSSIYPGS